jgi:two-component system sensor histidine kinase and response regulator WspE
MSGGRLDSTPAPLLALFLSDTEGYADSLKRNLVGLASDPNRQSAVLAEMRLAAHSIRGAAKIVGFEPAGALAAAIETTLHEVELSGVSIYPALGNQLLAATDGLAGIAQTSADSLGQWAVDNHDYVQRLLAALAPGAALDSLIQAPRVEKHAARPSASVPSVPPSAKASANIVELFRTETEACTGTLSRGLVALDSGASADLESLMRAAHSIKGAARIVGIDVAVQIAHALEDCLVKAQAGQLALPHEAVDLLLAAVDLLSEIALHALDGLDAWRAKRAGEAGKIIELLTLLAGGEISVAQPPLPSLADLAHPAEFALRSLPVAAPAAPSIQVRPLDTNTPGTMPRDRVVRVNAQSINRLMGLAGESLVESRRVQSFSASMQRLKRRQAELGTVLETLERQVESTLGRATLAEAKTRALECRSLLGEQMAELDGYARRVDDLSDRLYREALKSRMRPFGDCAHGFPRMVRDVARQLGKEVRFELRGEATDVDRDVLEGLEAPLTHLLRNAVDHGLETPAERGAAGKPSQGTLRIEARHHAGMLAISVSDDGRGLDPSVLRSKIVERGLLLGSVAEDLTPAELFEFIFLPGFSTARSVTEISGRGVGLDAVRSAVEAASGVVRVSSELGRGTSFQLQLPVTRSVMRAVVADVASEAYAFPLLRIERILRVPVSDVQTLGALQYFVLEGANVSLVSTQQVLGLGSDPPRSSEVCVVVIGDRARRYGLVVDKFLGEHDLVVRPLDARLGKVQDIAAAAILVDGSPALILDVDDLMRSIEKLAQTGRIDKLTAVAERSASKARKRVLIVDDSITVREVERQLLVNRGYEVDVAVDGIDGLNTIRGSRYDLVVSDVDMPRMNGLELVRAIKQDATLMSTPIIIVSYKDREEDRMRGLDAGANYYLTKSSFHDETLVQAVEELIGSADS